MPFSGRTLNFYVMPKILAKQDPEHIIFSFSPAKPLQAKFRGLLREACAEMENGDVLALNFRQDSPRLTYGQVERLLYALNEASAANYKSFQACLAEGKGSGFEELQKASDLLALQQMLQRESYAEDGMTWLEAASKCERGAAWLRSLFGLFDQPPVGS